VSYSGCAAYRRNGLASCSFVYNPNGECLRESEYQANPGAYIVINNPSAYESNVPANTPPDMTCCRICTDECITIDGAVNNLPRMCCLGVRGTVNVSGETRAENPVSGQWSTSVYNFTIEYDNSADGYQRIRGSVTYDGRNGFASPGLAGNDTVSLDADLPFPLPPGNDLFGCKVNTLYEHPSAIFRVSDVFVTAVTPCILNADEPDIGSLNISASCSGRTMTYSFSLRAGDPLETYGTLTGSQSIGVFVSTPCNNGCSDAQAIPASLRALL
jgi:hypothetical protein